jgi:arsenate reductase
MPNGIDGIKSCDTMKKERAWLDGHGVAYGWHDYESEGIAKDKLKASAKAIDPEIIAGAASRSPRMKGRTCSTSRWRMSSTRVDE